MKMTMSKTAASKRKRGSARKGRVGSRSKRRTTAAGKTRRRRTKVRLAARRRQPPARKSSAESEAFAAEAPSSPEVLHRSAESEYERALYEGGDKWVDQLLPHDCILPDYSVAQIIEAGLRQLAPHFIRVLSPEQVANAVEAALNERAPLSVVRLGDGELLTLSQETVLSVPEVAARGSFLSYAGIQVPDLDARNLLAEAVARADIVGVPKVRSGNFQPLLVPAFRAFGLEPRAMRLTYSTINYSLLYDGFFARIVKGRRVLTVGNHAGSLAEALARQGVEVVGQVAPVAGMKDVPRVMEHIAAVDFDLALVSAGVAAVPIAQRIATDLGRVALDFGHLADMIVSGRERLE